MITLVPDPSNPNRLTLTATVSIYLDKLLSDALSDEVSALVRQQARKDIQTNKAVKREIALAAQRLLLGMLGVATGISEPTAAPQPQQSALQAQSAQGSLQDQQSRGQAGD
jgi:hypothetical protein